MAMHSLLMEFGNRILLMIGPRNHLVMYIVNRVVHQRCRELGMRMVLGKLWIIGQKGLLIPQELVVLL
uniref:Uncharacterized protein MANES_07G093800 n=1 Tax=Rhizophora mucronata TaxID=61149 RepID=A0A2P2Q4F1_RHIMU